MPNGSEPLPCLVAAPDPLAESKELLGINPDCNILHSSSYNARPGSR
jgi:hypothetical protein